MSDFFIGALVGGIISGVFAFTFGYFHGCKVTNAAWLPFSKAAGQRITTLEDIVRRSM